jgi:hypothetical protein
MRKRRVLEEEKKKRETKSFGCCGCSVAVLPVTMTKMSRWSKIIITCQRLLLFPLRKE